MAMRSLGPYMPEEELRKLMYQVHTFIIIFIIWSIAKTEVPGSLSQKSAP
jgi:hypothetical protein